MILDIQDATITFPDGDRTLRALDGVSMKADAGELVAIVGESGSGKSTLLSVAAGLIAPDSGEVSVAGVEPATRTSARGCAARRSAWFSSSPTCWVP